MMCMRVLSFPHAEIREPANHSSSNIHTFIHCFFSNSAIHLYLVCLQAATEEKPAWSVLRDDFMMGATMKDWDKESDTEEATKRCGAGE